MFQKNTIVVYQTLKQSKSKVVFLNEVYLTGTVGDHMEDRGTADRFPVGHGAPAVSGLVVALHWQEVTVRTALWHKDGSCLQGLSPGQLTFGLTRIYNQAEIKTLVSVVSCAQ